MAIRNLITVCLLYWPVIAAGPILSTAALAADSSVNATVSVTHAEWAHCGNNLGIKMSLQVQVENASQKPLVLGRVAVAQERLYREGEKGKLELVGTTATPDEFARDRLDPFADIQEKKLSGHTSETFTIIHYAYMSSSDVQFDGDVAKIVASFHITNVRRTGSASDYWSRPVTITLPRNCKL
jgi:hypothetical protein